MATEDPRPENEFENEPAPPSDAAPRPDSVSPPVPASHEAAPHEPTAELTPPVVPVATPPPRGAFVPPPVRKPSAFTPDGTARLGADDLPVAHRGPLVLALGLGSLASLPLMCCCPGLSLLGIGAGVAACVLSKNDLRAMERGVMDPSGRGQTRAAFWCGVSGTALTVLAFVGWVCALFVPMIGEMLKLR